jgi:hypothetical protein
MDFAIRATHDTSLVPVLASPMPPEAPEIRQEVTAYLEADVDRSAVMAALHRARKQAFALATHGLKARTGAEPTEE